MMKKRILKVIYILVIFIIILVICYINIYPPVFEIIGTYHEYYSTEKSQKNVYKYYLVQNPPENNDDLVDMMKKYLVETDIANILLMEQIKNNSMQDISIQLMFCKKSYSPFGLHRFWRAERWDYIQSYSEYYIACYWLHYSYETGICTEEYAVFDPLCHRIETNTFEMLVK